MPSFLSKVLGRKKKDDKDESPRVVRDSTGELLLGDKFVEISPTVSPTAAQFSEADETGVRGRDNENGRFSLFRIRSGPTSPSVTANKRVEDEIPHLSLNLALPSSNESSASPRALGVVFEADPDAQKILPESVIGEKRLSPQETLVLVRACSQAIKVRGLETLGIMHPHWYSASPDVQRKLISLFIQSLASNPITTLAPSSSTTPISAFESELNFARSPHDVAAVLRWGLRHLQLETKYFGKDLKWYENFSQAERGLNYPPKAFSENLVPLLVPAHLELLLATLELVSSLAAHAEANSASGSKLSKFLGLWLLTSQRSEKDKDDWNTFYSRWERAGRILEHLFLSRIREEALDHRMPTRLQELVKQYPYSKYAVEGDDLLPRPRFSTRQYDALFIRVDTELPSSGRGAKEHPLRLIAEAFNAQLSPSSGSDSEVWERVKKAADEAEAESSPEGQSALTRIFADETVTLLNRIPVVASSTRTKTKASGPTPTPRSASPVRGRSFYSTDKANGNGAHAINGSSNVGAVDDKSTLKVPASIPLPPSPVTPDWAAFSTSGFGESPQPLAFLDKDVEKNKPVERRKSGKRRQKSATRSPRHQNAEVPVSPVTVRHEDNEKELPVTRPSVVTASSIKLDEAFIDFWSDTLLDPISAEWPAFVICKLKPLSNDEKPVSWLVIEQVHTPSPSQLNATSEAQGRKRAASPRPSFKSGGTFGGVKKRFSLFGGRSNSTASDKPKKKKHGEKDGKVGEMGEILDEETEKQNIKSADEDKAVQTGMAGVGVVAGATAAEELKEAKVEPSVTPISEAIKVPDEPETESKPEDLSPQKSHAIVLPNAGQPSVNEAPALPEPETSGPEVISNTAAPVQESQKTAAEPSAANGTVEPKGEVVAQVAEVQQQISEPSQTSTDAEPEGAVHGEGPLSLPAAHESVGLSGDTPGPQVALSTSEPVVVPPAAEPEPSTPPTIVDPRPTAPQSEPVTEMSEVKPTPPVDETTLREAETPPTAPQPEPTPNIAETPIVYDTSLDNEAAILPVEETSASTPEPQANTISEPQSNVVVPEVVPEQPSVEPDVVPEESIAASAEPHAPAEESSTSAGVPEVTPEESSAAVAQPDVVAEEYVAAPVEPQADAVKEAEAGQELPVTEPTEPPSVDATEPGASEVDEIAPHLEKPVTPIEAPAPPVAETPLDEVPTAEEPVLSHTEAPAS